MSPRKSYNNSKKSSPNKAEEVFNTNIINESPTKQVKKSTGLKLRLKVSSTESTSTATSTSTSVDDLRSAVQEVKFVPKIKLNFSRSNESVEDKKSGKRGRPKKDKSAVIAAAIAASQPNELESEERKSRRRAAEEKIKKSASMDSVTSASSSTFEGDNEGDGSGGKRRRSRKISDETEEVDGEEGGKRRRRRGSNEGKNIIYAPRQLSKSSEFIDITDGSNNRTSNVNSTSVAVHPTPASSNPHETEFIQRSKTFLNIAMQHDTFLYTSNLANPMEVPAFKSIEDAVEKLLAYHVGIGAGQYSQEELEGKFMDIVNDDIDAGGKHMKKYEDLQEKYKSVIQSQSTKKVPTELLLLEQRLCLEEEKFLLVKLKNEYAAKFMRSGSSSTTGMGSSGNSRPSTPASNNSNSSGSNSRPDSVINQ